jgi:nitroreductase
VLQQPNAHYKLHFITDQELIAKIHALTPVEKVGDLETITTNSQVLANLLVVFEKYMDMSNKSDQYRNKEVTALFANGEKDPVAEADLMRDAHVAVGIAAGYLNLTSSLLGYRSGCCQCMDQNAIQELLGLDGVPLLLMGIGYNDESRPRRQHATDESYMFPTRKKQEIKVSIVE